MVLIGEVLMGEVCDGGPGDRWGHWVARPAAQGGLLQRSLLGLLSPRAHPLPALRTAEADEPTTEQSGRHVVRLTEGVSVKFRAPET